MSLESKQLDTPSAFSLEHIQMQAEVFAWDPVIPAMLDAFPCPAGILTAGGQFVSANNPFVEQFGQGKADWYEARTIGDIFQCVHTLSSRGGCGTAPPCNECEGYAILQHCAEFNGQCTGECSIMTHEGAKEYKLTASPIEFAGVRYIVLAVQPVS